MTLESKKKEAQKVTSQLSIQEEMIIINALKELNLDSWIINFKHISPVLLLQLKLLMDIQHT